MRSSGGGSSSSFLTSQSYSCSYSDLACDYTLQVQQCWLTAHLASCGAFTAFSKCVLTLADEWLLRPFNAPHVEAHTVVVFWNSWAGLMRPHDATQTRVQHTVSTWRPEAVSRGDCVLEKHHKPCVNFLPCLAEQPNVLKCRIICIIFINFTLRSVRWAWPQLPNAWGSWSGPYRWCQWTRQSLSPQSGLGEGQPLWAVGSIQSKTYLLPWRSYLSTASLSESVRAVSSAINYSIHTSSSKSNGVFL